MRISNSFSEDEVKVLTRLCRKALYDPALARLPGFRSALKKVQHMEERFASMTPEQKALAKETEVARKREYRKLRLA